MSTRPVTSRSAHVRRRVGVATALTVAAVLVVVVLAGGGDRGHRLTVLAPEARFIRADLEVRMSGAKVGRVVRAEATRRGTARVELEIDDERAWPLPRGTTATFRWAGTIAFTNRYVELQPPAPGGPTLPEGAVLRGSDVIPSVEVDQIAALFDAPGRADLEHLLRNTGASLHAARPELPGALREAPAALDQAQGLLRELGDDRESLDTLVRSADSVVHAIATSRPGLRQLLEGTGRTLAAVGRRRPELETVLRDAPRTLAVTRRTLQRADGTLRTADVVLRDLRPGVRELRRISTPLSRTLSTARRVVPDASRTVGTLGRATKDLDPLLRSAVPLLQRTAPVAEEAARQLDCIRPYAPELAGLASNWTGFEIYGDDRDKFARVNGAVYPHPTSATPADSKEWTSIVPGLDYAFFRPPGHAAGQNWYVEGCGITAADMDPANDPEGRGR